MNKHVACPCAVRMDGWTSKCWMLYVRMMDGALLALQIDG